MSVPNLLTLDAIPAQRIATWNVGSAQQQFTLTALSRPDSPYSLALKIVGPNLTVETVEYRQAEGWDAGFPVNLVLVHKYVAGGKPLSILRNGPTSPDGGVNGGWVAGQLLIASDGGYSLYVDSVDPATGTALVTVSSL
jgi:hypothetical protein